MRQTSAFRRGEPKRWSLAMPTEEPVRILQADIVDASSELIVYFSDSTVTIFHVSDLLAFAPNRKKVEDPTPGQ